MLFVITSCYILYVAAAWAQVKPVSGFGNHMVLQRDIPVPVWGTAKAEEKITLKLNDWKLKTRADVSGRRSVVFRLMRAGGPCI